MKKILFLLIASRLIASDIMAQYSGGDGSKNSPFLISVNNDMETLAAATRAGNDYSGRYFSLTTDLDGISTVTGTFRGVFEGNGHIINLNLGSALPDTVGVFGVIKKAVIRNLGVSGNIISGSICGGICGYADSSAISNCYNAGNITGSQYAGGICGYMRSGSAISNCYNTGNITSSASSGGICGYMNSASAVSECYNTGNITSSTSAGGICGYTFRRDSIKNCFAANEFLAGDNSDVDDPMARRILGYNSDRVVFENCYALSSMAVNGQPMPGSNPADNNGKDAELTNFQDSSWIKQNLRWDLDAVWFVPKNQGLPILRIFISEITIDINIKDKEYDGNNTAEIHDYQLVGVKGRDNVFANIADVTATFNDKNAGSEKPVSLSPITLFGGDAGKYILKQPTELKAAITKKAITVTADPKSKTQGEADPPLTYTPTPNLIAGDAFTGKLEREPGEAPRTYRILQGTLSPGNNYDVTYREASFTIIGNGLIEITISLSISKEYDGTTAASISSFQLFGVNSGDNVTANTAGVTATFNDKNAGANKPVSLNGTITLSGTDAGKYSLTQPTGVTGSIAQKVITVTANPQSKKQGEADPEFTYTKTSDLIAGDSITGKLGRDPGEESGIYRILQGTLSFGANYHIEYRGALFTIIGEDVPASLVINGELVGIASGGRHLRYSLDCGCGETTLKVIPPATIKGYPATYTAYTFDPKEGRNTFFVEIPQEGAEKTPVDTLTIINPPSMLVITVWDDVLSVVNNPDNNGGFKFDSYQWQENGIDILSETKGNYLVKDFTSVYTVRLTSTEGEEFTSCPVRLPALSPAMPLKVYPNPVVGTATVESSAAKPDDKMEIYNINGDLVQKLRATGRRTEINLSALATGSYVLKVNNERVKLFKKNK